MLGAMVFINGISLEAHTNSITLIFPRLRENGATGVIIGLLNKTAA
jgi:hypothetical protein